MSEAPLILSTADSNRVPIQRHFENTHATPTQNAFFWTTPSPHSRKRHPNATGVNLAHVQEGSRLA
jgi:hypothetical protein